MIIIKDKFKLTFDFVFLKEKNNKFLLHWDFYTRIIISYKKAFNMIF